MPPDAPVPPSLPLYARPPGSGPTPKGIYHDPATSWKMAKTLLKGMGPMLKGKSKGPRKAHKVARAPAVKIAAKK